MRLTWDLMRRRLHQATLMERPGVAGYITRKGGSAIVGLFGEEVQGFLGFVVFVGGFGDVVRSGIGS